MITLGRGEYGALVRQQLSLPRRPKILIYLTKTEANHRLNDRHNHQFQKLFHYALARDSVGAEGLALFRLGSDTTSEVVTRFPEPNKT